MDPCRTTLTQGSLRALQAHVVLCMLPKIHRHGHHWATAEAGQAQDHVPLKTQWLKLPLKDWTHLKSHLCPKKYVDYTQNICLTLSLFPDLLIIFALVALGAAAFVAVQQRIHFQVSLVCSCARGAHRVPCTSSTLKWAGFWVFSSNVHTLVGMHG